MDQHFQNAISALTRTHGSEKIALDFDRQTAIFNAQADQFFKQFKRLLCIQHLYPDFALLRNGGFTVEQRYKNAEFNTAILFATKYKERNLYDLAMITRDLAENGTVIVIAPNALGGTTLAKTTQKLFGGGDIAKISHSALFSTAKNSATVDHELLNEFLALGTPKKLSNGYETACGMFSFGAVDIGSKLLITTLKAEKIAGNAADLGAGWGYLSGELLKLHSAISMITLYEADFNALELAKTNINNPKAVYNWCDITALEAKKQFDIIITNPPFHLHANTSIYLGEQFIRKAKQLLKNNGIFYMVANRHLPYERSLKSLFEHIEVLADHDGFKVLKAH